MRFDRHANRALLLDGAMGTELIARGLRVREECPEAWNLDRPDDVRAIHAAYAAAGSDAVQTNTFGCTRPRLKRFGREAQVAELARAAVRLAREGAAGRLVFGSLGPSGETLPLGAGAELGWLEEAYAEAARALAEKGVDAIHLETMFHPAELAAAVRGVRAGAPSVPVIASMTLMAGVSGLETPHGVPIARMLRAVESTAPDAVGVNCSIDAERMRPAVEALRDALELPIVAQPQAKISEKCATGRSSESPDTFARRALALVDAGASVIGGCCGVGPTEIAALRRALDARQAQVAS
ncbi:MAG TPA: homocysteine S-methyltransferase family protein [Polyangia bacterium]|nr:homocysteine S-methyltransferase family protein [Polyangia bacterium]